MTSRLIEVWHGAKAEAKLERYDRQRRLVTLEYIEKQSIQNKRNLESDGSDFGRSLAEIAADKWRTYEYLLRVSMIASLRRAQELGGSEPARPPPRNGPGPRSLACENDVPEQRVDLVGPAIAAEHPVVSDPRLHVVALEIGAQA